MLTPEVQQFITQSRAAGTPDAQIRATLQSQGWSAADISQAFEVGATPGAVVAGGISGTMIAIIVAVLVVAMGAGVYYFVSKKNSTPTPSTNNAIATPTASSAPFHCKDLFPENSDLVVKFDEKFYPYNTVYPDGSLRYKAWNLACTGQSLHLLVILDEEPNSVDKNFETASKVPNGHPIQGIGSSAVEWDNINTINVESSNHKYFFSVVGGNVMSIETVAKTVDANLNKY